MATVPIYVGQCGNQIGYQFDVERFENQLSTSETTRGRTITRSSNTRSGKASDTNYRDSIMIDTESKVINKLAKLHLTKSSGKLRARNPVLEKALESVRRQAERCDMFNNILLISSLCGGTGGGLGSRILESLRGEFRLEHIISCVVAPFLTGDTPLQHYNALLSLASLQKFSDAVLLFKNDMVSSHCHTSSSVEQGTDHTGISYTHMNRYIASCLAEITTPTDTLTPSSGFGCNLELSELVRSVCPQPSLKFLTTNQATRAIDDVKALCNSVIGLTKKESMSTKCHSLSNVAVIRGGSTSNSVYATLPAMEQRIKKDLRAVSWNPFPVDYWLSSECLAKGKSGNHSFTLVTNYSNIIPYAEHVWVKAKQMYTEKAYIHWYYKHGLCQDYFEEAFSTVEDIIHGYTDAVK
ncbi:hypothetical protein EB796_010437 [Bugula neritina]|uniref:Tubulin delta chain n=1 Tax=Bugula neritina TaxID=10212 RepID=A0A7J7JZW1_BUGNE|nr:hypothetical protein EB796_010437 [Bugula neritina]